jgi:predicted nucleic acid-binding protein
LYLVDTNIISLLAPSRSTRLLAFAEWLEQHTDELYLSAITVAEIAEGIAKARREAASRKAEDLQAWLDAVLELYGDRVLPMDVETAEHVGSLSDLAHSNGRPPGLADIIVAATAQRHTMTILTRNIRHFLPLGVPTIDPYGKLPP